MVKPVEAGIEIGKLVLAITISGYDTPIMLDGGKTIVYIADKSKESETRKRYDARLDNALLSSLNKSKT